MALAACLRKLPPSGAGMGSPRPEVLVVAARTTPLSLHTAFSLETVPVNSVGSSNLTARLP